MSSVDVLCIDLGASNGRGIIGSFDGNKLALREAHRFGNEPVAIFSHLYWDTFHLYKEMHNCLRAAYELSSELRSFGIDGWSQDFGLVGRQGQLLAVPRHYRDPRTEQIADWAHLRMSQSELYARTGKSPASISTLFQLLAMQHTEQEILDNSHMLLFMPNLLGYFLTGEANCDVTLASASALYNPRTGDWCKEIRSAFGLPNLLPDISRPGRIIGDLSKDAKQQAGISGIGRHLPLISVAQHDTISALISAHSSSHSSEAVYISCGTWSVVGTTAPAPIVHEQAMEGGFSNEPGYYDGLHFVVKYMTGLWILQECIREWNQAGLSFDYKTVQHAAVGSSFNASINVEHEAFASPGQMLDKIVQYCRDTQQQVPRDQVEFFICIMVGLARSYTETVLTLQTLTSKTFHEIRIVGGGSRNAYLCQITARLSGIKVVAGPVEASVAGNALIQLISLGEIGGINEVSEIMQHSLNCSEYHP